MIEYCHGNLFEADAEALVNPVNTQGVMGKGLALAFKKMFPENFDAYAEACQSGQIKTGKMFVTEQQALIGPRWIINFPTKQYWRDPSRLEWIEEGLSDLKKILIEQQIQSVAVPPLGCGLGGLDWKLVKPRIEDSLTSLSSVRVLVFEPPGS
ncbi:MAG: putative phosphatase homologous to the C-terminal domain of histone macroH2A1 [Marinobacter excellens HL-55]|uniref:Putative phosphatase homologous to the C-terminal domain of histone macroH2A1 n=1 Tax=Marinobacter excellens HL-55 TaxID=1305731 RepID=A0A0P7YZU9_9GAMM|nr:MAG: putative phosphatase homologous to the C-terminal domain of histone macroH2A1 [Marinobacter excellens HL-55]